MTPPEPTTPADLEAPPVIDPIPEKRNPWGWVLLATIFTLLLLNGPSKKNRSTPEARRASYSVRLKSALVSHEAGRVSTLLSGYTNPDTPLRVLERESAVARRTDPLDATVWAAVRTELREPVSKEDLAPAERSRDYAAFAKVYSDAKLTRGEVRDLVPRLGTYDGLAELAANHARKRAGLPVVAKGLDRSKTIGIGLLFVGMLFASGFAWLALIGFGLAESLRSQGPAITVRSGAEADQLALRAAMLMVGFLLLGAVVGLAGIGGALGQALTFLPMLAVVPLVLSKSPSMAQVGLSTKTLGRDILLGLWGFLLELPVTLIVSFVCMILMRNFPAPEHPATTALENGADTATILVTLVSGAIIAPLWEETMFRGLLFPALRTVLSGPILAALVSSFLFASIHPQGPVLWGALGSVALFSCILAQNTRSLVPSVVMHMAHNATILTLTVLISQK